MALLRALLAVSLASTTVFGIQLWAKPAEIPSSVPAKCRAALTTNITCEFLVTANKAVNGQVLAGESAISYCGDTCVKSLLGFQQTVTAGCGNTQYMLWENSTLTQSGQALTDGLVWAQNLVCIEDKDGYCLADFMAGNRTACSDCSLKYAQAMVSSDYGRARVPEDQFTSLLSSCSVPTSSYTWTYTPVPTANATTTTTSPATTPTCAGTTYTVKSGDTCESISKANSVATDRMILLNNLDYKCASLVEGRELCIQDTCKLATIQNNQTCDDLVEGTGFTVVQLQSWNPTLKSMCDSNIIANLDTLTGRSICIQAPGQYDFPTSDVPTTTSSFTFTSPFFTGSWTPGPPVQTDAPPPQTNFSSLYDPSYTPPAETISFNATLSSVIAEATQYCWITEEDWAEGFDPESMPPACQSLMSTYCTYNSTAPTPTPISRAPAACTPDRSWYNLDPLPDPVTTPKPVQPGMTKGCSKFYKVASGDICETVIANNGITAADFYTWNPDIGSDCRNLQLGVYVCVGYDAELVVG